MIVLDEFYNQIVFEFSSEQLVAILQEIKVNKENEINMIKDKIIKYEHTKRAHEVWYQSLSPVRKFFAGRPPSHHQAVEYIVNVKERFNRIEKIKILILQIEKIISMLEEVPEMEQIILPVFMIEDIKVWRDKGDRQI